MMQQQPMMSPQGRPPQGAPRQGIAQLNPNVPMQTQLNQLSKLPPQQLEARKNESFLAAIAAEQQAAKAEAAQREKLMLENPELATDEKIIDRLRQSTIASMMPPTNPMPSVMDKAQGVAGVLQNKTAKRKRSMNNLANAGLPATGKPPMKSMASGGILGYNDGGTVTEADIDQWLENNPRVFSEATPDKRRAFARKVLLRELPAKLKEERTALSQSTPVTAEEREAFKKANPRVFPKATDERMDAIIQKETYGERDLTGNTATDISTMDLEASVIADAEQLKEETATARVEALPSQVAQEVESALAPVKPSTIYDKDTDSFMPISPAPLTSPATAGPAGATASTTAGTNAQLSRQEQIDEAIGAIGTKDYKKDVGEKQVTEALGQPYINTLTGMQEADPEAKKLAEEQRLDLRFNPDDRIGELGRKQQERYEGILNAQQDPARMQKLKRIAMGIGAAGQTDMGGIAAGIGAANLNFERQKDLSQLAGSRGLASLEDTDINRKTNVLKDSTSGAATLGESIRADRRSSMATGATIAEADLTAARTDVKNAFDRDVQIAGMSAKQYANELSADMNLLIKEANNVQALAAIQRQLNDAVAKSAEALSNQFNSSRILKAENELDNAEKERLNKGEPPETDNGRLIAKYNATKKALNEQMGLDTLRATIEKKQKDLSGSAMLSPAQQAALDRI